MDMPGNRANGSVNWLAMVFAAGFLIVLAIAAKGWRVWPFDEPKGVAIGREAARLEDEAASREESRQRSLVDLRRSLQGEFEATKLEYLSSLNAATEAGDLVQKNQIALAGYGSGELWTGLRELAISRIRSSKDLFDMHFKKHETANLKLRRWDWAGVFPFPFSSEETDEEQVKFYEWLDTLPLDERVRVEKDRADRKQEKKR